MTLQGWWPLHDTNATDYSGNDNHGTLNGGVTTGVAGKAGLEAMSFDGTDDYIDMGASPAALDATKSHSAFLWWRPESTAQDQTLFEAGQGSSNVVAIGTSQDTDGVLIAQQYDGDSWYYVGTTSFSTVEDWISVGYSYDASSDNLRVYVNGSEVAEEPSANNAGTAGNGNLVLGAQADGSMKFTSGALAGVRAYNRVLSPSEFRRLHDLGSADIARPPNDGVAYYKLDGDTTDSWNNNDGTNNGVTFTTDAIRGQSGEFESANNDHINAGDLGDPQAVYTVSYWVKQSSTTNSIYSLEYAVDVGTGDFPPYLYRFEHNNVSNGSIEFGVRDGSDNVTELTLTENAHKEWVHVCGIRDGTNVYGYLNGKQVASGTIPNATNKYDGSGVFLLGRRGNGDHFKGRLEDVRIYDYALTPSKVHELYRYGTRGKDMRKHLVNRRQK